MSSLEPTNDNSLMDYLESLEVMVLDTLNNLGDIFGLGNGDLDLHSSIFGTAISEESLESNIQVLERLVEPNQ